MVKAKTVNLVVTTSPLPVPDSRSRLVAHPGPALQLPVIERTPLGSRWLLGRGRHRSAWPGPSMCRRPSAGEGWDFLGRLDDGADEHCGSRGG
jgi:hypothetical protein